MRMINISKYILGAYVCKILVGPGGGWEEDSLEVRFLKVRFLNVLKNIKVYFIWVSITLYFLLKMIMYSYYDK